MARRYRRALHPTPWSSASRARHGGNEVDDPNFQFIDDTGAPVGDNVAALTMTGRPRQTRDYIARGHPDGYRIPTSAAGLIPATAAAKRGGLLTRVLVAWIRISWPGDDPVCEYARLFTLAE